MAEVPRHLCECGCGQETRVAGRSSRRDGQIKGQALRFIKGHNGRRSAALRLMENVRAADIAAMYGVHYNTIYQAWTRTWANV